MDSPPFALSLLSESLEFRQSLQLDVDTAQSITTATKPETVELQVPPQALAQLTMSSSPTPFKRVASGGDTGDQKASDRNKVDDNDAFESLSGINDENEDMDTVAPADEEVVETTETNTEGPEQTPELDAKLLKIIKEVRDREERINRKKKETEEARSKIALLNSVTKEWVKHTDTAEKILQKHGGDTFEKETQRLKVITRFINDLDETPGE